MTDGLMHSTPIARHTDRGFAIIDRGGPACDIVRDGSHGDASVFVDEIMVFTPSYNRRNRGAALPAGHLEALLARWIDQNGWYYC